MQVGRGVRAPDGRTQPLACEAVCLRAQIPVTSRRRQRNELVRAAPSRPLAWPSWALGQRTASLAQKAVRACGTCAWSNHSPCQRVGRRACCSAGRQRLSNSASGAKLVSCLICPAVGPYLDVTGRRSRSVIHARLRCRHYQCLAYASFACIDSAADAVEVTAPRGWPCGRIDLASEPGALRRIHRAGRVRTPRAAGPLYHMRSRAIGSCGCSARLTTASTSRPTARAGSAEKLPRRLRISVRISPHRVQLRSVPGRGSLTGLARKRARPAQRLDRAAYRPSLKSGWTNRGRGHVDKRNPRQR
jgi:hypothetical protein